MGSGPDGMTYFGGRIRTSGQECDPVRNAEFKIRCIRDFIVIQNIVQQFITYYKLLVGFGRACAPVRCAHPSYWAKKHAKRALRAPPIAASLLPKKFKQINYFQKQNASLQAQTRPASGVYFSTGLSCTLLNYITSY